MDRQQLTEALIPGFMAYGRNEAEARAVLNQTSLSELQELYNRQVARGLIKPQQPAPAVDTAKQAREKLQREYLENEKQQLLRQQQQLTLEALRDSIFKFGQIVPGKALARNAANRKLIDWESLDTPQQIQDFIKWLKDSPHILRELAFEESPPPKPSSKQRQEDDRFNAEQARIQRDKDWSDYIKWLYLAEFPCSPSPANFDVMLAANDGPGLFYEDNGKIIPNNPVMTMGDGHVYAMDGDGGLHELLPATPEEKEAGRVAYLKALAKTNNDAELHQIVKEGTHKPSETTPATQVRMALENDRHPELPANITRQTIRGWTAQEMKEAIRTYGNNRITARFNGLDGETQPIEQPQQTKLQQDLALQFERDTAAGYTTPLPERITRETIQKWSASEMREQMKRYGPGRVTARWHGIFDVRNAKGELLRIQ